jgi:hypothetical protein
MRGGPKERQRARALICRTWKRWFTARELGRWIQSRNDFVAWTLHHAVADLRKSGRMIRVSGYGPSSIWAIDQKSGLTQSCPYCRKDLRVEKGSICPA